MATPGIPQTILSSLLSLVDYWSSSGRQYAGSGSGAAVSMAGGGGDDDSDESAEKAEATALEGITAAECKTVLEAASQPFSAVPGAGYLTLRHAK